MSNDPASLHPASAAANMIMLPYSEAGSSAPPSPRDETSDLVFVTYNGRQVVLGWSPSLEEAKATACNDLGLTERGYSGRDIAFLFHPPNDPENRLIEVLASAWPKLRSLPHFQLVLRSEDDTSPSSHHPVFQRTQAGHPSASILRTQPSTLTNSGRSQKSKENDHATPSNTEASNSSSRVDIENWRRNQTSHYYQEGQPGGHRHQVHVNLPQHALPSPPLSEAQSHRGPSPYNEQYSPTSSSANYSGNMEVDHQHALSDSQLSSLHDHPASSNTGFLAQTGRRTTVHFPHTLPAAKLEILAPTPIRRSHSQELLNPDCTDSKPNRSQELPQNVPHVHPPTRHRSATTQYLAISKQNSRHQLQESGSAYKARSYSQVCSSNILQYPPQHAAKASTRPSSLRNSWDTSLPVPDNEDAHFAPAPQLNPQDMRNLRSAGMQRSSSHSTLSLSSRPSHSHYDDLASPPPFGHDLHGRSIGSMSQPLCAPFNLKADPFGLRRASLPDALHPVQVPPFRPVSMSADSTPTQQSSSGQRKIRAGTRAPPVVDFEMGNEASSSDEEDARWSNAIDQEPSTPKRSIAEKTLRRLKSSPSGLADQYSRQRIPIEMPMHLAGLNHVASGAPQLASSTKRGPTSWPNSPVKRNTSLFTLRPDMHPKDSFHMINMPLAPPSTAGTSSSSHRKKERHASMSPPPPPPPMPCPEYQTERIVSRAMLDGAIPPFLLDKKRPDSPMPPLYPFRSLPPSPQTKLNQTAFADVANDSEMSGADFQFLTATQDYSGSQSRYRGRNSQSAEDLFRMANTPSSGQLPDHLPLPKMRSQVNLATNGKTRRSRTH